MGPDHGHIAPYVLEGRDDAAAQVDWDCEGQVVLCLGPPCGVDFPTDVTLHHGAIPLVMTHLSTGKAGSLVRA